MHRMTASRYRALLKCIRYHYYRYVLRFEAVKTAPALLFGTLVHMALEAWWLAWKAGKGGEAALGDALTALEREAPDWLDLFVWVQLEVLVVGYHERWAPTMDEIEVLDVERWFEGPLVNPDTGEVSEVWELAGKMDVLIRQRGKVYVVEHKTTSADTSPGSSYWTRLRMDPQISIYIDGAATLGYAVDGCLYDVIRKPELRPLNATPEDKRKYRNDGKLYAKQRERDETAAEYKERILADIAKRPEHYYKRVEVVRLDHELDEARRDLWAAAQFATMTEGAHAPRASQACFRYGSACEFFDVCSGAGSLEDESKFRRRTSAKHKERAI